MIEKEQSEEEKTMDLVNDLYPGVTFRYTAPSPDVTYDALPACLVADKTVYNPSDFFDDMRRLHEIFRNRRNVSNAEALWILGSHWSKK